jgi:hypothetical protein
MCRAKRWSHAGRRWAGPHPHGRVQSSTRRHKSLYSTPMSMHRYHPCRCWWRCRSSHRHKRRQPHQWWCRRCCRRRRCSPRSTRCTTPLRDNTAASGEARGSRHAGGYKFALYLQVTRGTGAVAGVCQGREGGGCAPRTWTIGILEHLTAARGQHVHLRPVARPCRRRHRKHTGGRAAAQACGGRRQSGPRSTAHRCTSRRRSKHQLPSIQHRTRTCTRRRCRLRCTSRRFRRPRRWMSRPCQHKSSLRGVGERMGA